MRGMKKRTVLVPPEFLPALIHRGDREPKELSR